LRIRLWRIFATLGLLVVVLGVCASYTIYHVNFRAVGSGNAYRSGQMIEEQLTRTIQDHGIKIMPVIHPKVLAMDRSCWRYVSNRVAHAELNLQFGSMAS
jgi:hypothetical protein